MCSFSQARKLTYVGFRTSKTERSSFCWTEASGQYFNCQEPTSRQTFQKIKPIIWESHGAIGTGYPDGCFSFALICFIRQEANPCYQTGTQTSRAFWWAHHCFFKTAKSRSCRIIFLFFLRPNLLEAVGICRQVVDKQELCKVAASATSISYCIAASAVPQSPQSL